MLYYRARLYGNQLAEAEGYKKLCPVISISFVNHRMYRQVPQGHHCWQWRTEDGMLLTEHGQIHIVELPKYTGRVTKKEKELARWVKFLREGDTMTAQAIQQLGDPNIEHAYAELERLSRDPKMRMYYEERLKGLKDYVSGLELSFEHGKIEGKIEGEEEGQAKLVQRMHHNGISASQIAQMIGTTVSQVKMWLAQSLSSPVTPHIPNVGEPAFTVVQSETPETPAPTKKKARASKKK